jgi:hypothetical protein
MIVRVVDPDPEVNATNAGIDALGGVLAKDRTVALTLAETSVNPLRSVRSIVDVVIVLSPRLRNVGFAVIPSSGDGT